MNNEVKIGLESLNRRAFLKDMGLLSVLLFIPESQWTRMLSDRTAQQKISDNESKPLGSAEAFGASLGYIAMRIFEIYAKLTPYPDEPKGNAAIRTTLRVSASVAGFALTRRLKLLGLIS